MLNVAQESNTKHVCIGILIQNVLWHVTTKFPTQILVPNYQTQLFHCGFIKNTFKDWHDSL
jgi:hypothetical protein